MSLVAILAMPKILKQARKGKVSQTSMPYHIPHRRGTFKVQDNTPQQSGASNALDDTRQQSGAPKVLNNTPQQSGASTDDYASTKWGIPAREVQLCLRFCKYAESGLLLGCSKRPDRPELLYSLYADELGVLGRTDSTTRFTEWAVVSNSLPPMPSTRAIHLQREWFPSKRWHPLSDLDSADLQTVYMMKRQIIDSATAKLMRYAWPGTVGFGVRICRRWDDGKALAELYTYNARWCRIAVESSPPRQTVALALYNLRARMELLEDSMYAPDAPPFLAPLPLSTPGLFPERNGRALGHT
ncbi:hypothetical protein UCDDS831_g02817 [Diplodia seriata]|uniref:Uncharacterized protein n=1 Tax=Diplodia seriata TaxID=420778 RepID=A0A0G2ENV2_9PEZI|nr:hypothetical protein UCDDS831_g02817 [Diplodia seriata]